MLVIRMRRTGSKKRPHYRVVVTERRSPPSNKVCASAGPNAHTRLGSDSQLEKLELARPALADNVSDGYCAAMATPICALAAATRRSAAAISRR